MVHASEDDVISGLEKTHTPMPGELGLGYEATHTPSAIRAEGFELDDQNDLEPKDDSLDGSGRGLSDTHTPAPAKSDGRSSGSWADGPPPTLHVGRLLANRYHVGDRIGMGGMASVHVARDKRLDRLVAIKILHPHIAENPDARTRLGREAQAIAQLKHESVIEVYDVDVDDPECTWLVTELIEGTSLRGALEQLEKPLPEVSVMIVTEIVRALRAAHDVGIIHRDVKPDNVLIGKSGRPKLSDFGIAQIISEERMTLTGNLVGSPSYMSPEQAEGRRIDHRTDLFSAGIVLYRLLTNRLPFAGQNAIDTLRKVASVDYVDPAETDPDLPGPIVGIVRRALAANIEDRYQTADQMLEDLQAVLLDAGLSATSEELPKFFRDAAIYQNELTPRLAQTLSSRGQSLIESGDEARGLDCLNRAMTLGASSNERTLDLVRVLSKRRERGRLQRVAIAALAAVGAVAVISGGIWALGSRPTTQTSAAAGLSQQAGAETIEGTTPEAPKVAAAQKSEGTAPTEPVPTAPDTPKAEGAATANEKPRTETSKPEPTKSVKRTTKARRRRTRTRPPPKPRVKPPVATPVVAQPAKGVLQVGTSRWVDVYVDGVKLGRAPDRSKYQLPPGTHTLRAVNPRCNPVNMVVKIRSGETSRVRLPKLVCQ